MGGGGLGAGGARLGSGGWDTSCLGISDIKSHRSCVAPSTKKEA